MKLLDRLRGAYVSAPPWVRSAAAAALGLLPAGLLYGRSYEEWRARIARSRRDPAFAEQFARTALSEVLTGALQHSAFYREHVTRRAVDTREAFEALGEFPILSKAQVRDHAADIAVVPLDELDLVTTSGSSGAPLQVWLDRDRGVRETAFIHEVWSRSGFKAGNPRGVFRGVQIDNVDRKPMAWEPALKELRCSPFHLTDAHMADYALGMERRGIRYLHGYPSALAIFSSFLQRADVGWRGTVRGVFPISEPMYGDQWPILIEGFPNARILPFYGMSEKVAFGEPVEGQPGHYAMNPLYGWTELVDEGGETVTAPGRTGRVVGTGFISRGMPLIRYDTGDVAELVAPPTAETGWRLVVTSLGGRWRREFLVSDAGALLSMSALNIHSANYLSMREFMFAQSEPGRATLRAVPAPGRTRADVEGYVAELRGKVGTGVAFELELVDSLPPAPRGKRKFIDQKLDLSRYGG